MSQPPVRLDELIGYVRSQDGIAAAKRQAG
jgi:hypothetical protein